MDCRRGPDAKNPADRYEVPSQRPARSLKAGAADKALLMATGVDKTRPLMEELENRMEDGL
eukprot:765852-Hanusia_phi.AAC.3